MTAVVILTTGGTIASRPDPDAGGVRAVVSGAELAKIASAMVPGVEVRVDEVLRTGGYLMNQELMLQLAERCREHALSPDVAGIVVTHGTDTMEESAYLVDLLYGADKPVVFTGAQRNAADSDGDGPRNLRNAVRIAVDPQAEGIGAVICMDGRIDGARHGTKVDTIAVRAFGSPGHGQVGEVTDQRVAIFHRRVRPRQFDDVHALPDRVDIVKLYAGIDGTFLRAAREAGARGVVLEAFGLGNANLEILQEVTEAIAAGVVVLVCSRCHQGFVWPTYSNGGGYDLAKAGAIFGGNLKATKARLLLLAALASAGSQTDALPQLLEPHLCL